MWGEVADRSRWRAWPGSTTGGRRGTSEGAAVVAGQAASGGAEAADGGEGPALLQVAWPAKL